MPEIVVDDASTLARYATWTSARTQAPVAAVRVDGGEPWCFVENEVLVDARERDVLEDLVARGGELVEEPALPPRPLAPTRDGFGSEPRPLHDRDPRAALEEAPVTTTVRFDRPPDADPADLGALLSGAGHPGELLRLSSRAAVQVAAALAPYRAERRRVGLNLVGRELTMPLSAPLEGSSPAYSNDPLTWPTMVGRSRIADAWQLVDSVRRVRGVDTVFVAVSDSGFWLDGAGLPVVPAGQPASDLGAGVLQWNLRAEGQRVPSGTTSFHGNRVASAAAGAVGNLAGAAGAGGTVARPALFETALTAAHAMRAARLCVWWGIDVLNMSWGFWGQSEFWFDSDTWEDTFEWAGANGLVVVAAAGNSALDLPDDENIRPATRTPRTLTVGALDGDGARASSNFGPSVDLWAPGTNVPVAPDALLPQGGTVSGTSFAAPLVAGTAAMMRAVNPGLGADDVRRILVATGWPGTGRVTRGLDAYAAVWEALSRTLPDTSEGNDSPTSATPLVPTAAGGPLGPPGGFTALSGALDRDYWSFRLDRLLAVTVTLDWYDRLADLRVRVESGPSPATDAGLAVARSAGRTVLTGLLAAGDYRVRVTGSGASAYRLTVATAAPRLRPDPFEPNDRPESAARLRFVPRDPRWEPYLLRGWGPGSYPATLHRAASVLGWSVVNRDWYRLDAPDAETFTYPAVQLDDTDEPLDVSLHDEAGAVLASWSGVRDLVVEPPPGRTTYLQVSGQRETRYRIAPGMRLRRDLLPPPLQEELVFPERWWGDPPPYRLVEEVTRRVVLLGREELQDGALALAGDGDGPAGLPEGTVLELLDAEGAVVREGAVVAGALVVDLAGLEPGAFVLRTSVPPDAVGAAAVRGVPPPVSGWA